MVVFRGVRIAGVFASALFLASVTWASVLPQPLLPGVVTASRTESHHALDIPILASSETLRAIRRRGDLTGDVGVGNNARLLYVIPVALGSVVIPLHLDTGSSDLWVISEDCQRNTCENTVAGRYPSTSLVPAGIPIRMAYGDSTSGTFASGVVGYETVTIAGAAMVRQPFALVNDTNNSVLNSGISGIFGLGFPTGSRLQESLIEQLSGPIIETDEFLLSLFTNGPLLARMLATGEFDMPLFTISLQRNSIDISGQGLLTIGKLTDGIEESAFTWVPVRLYEPAEGGTTPPSFAPNEVYPYRWEIELEGVYLDGTRLPDSTIPARAGGSRVSALLDTGNSILRGPDDVVESILSSIDATYDHGDPDAVATIPCNEPHTLAFQFGGKMFPVDPRDFINPQRAGDTSRCRANNLLPTDTPSSGALYRWSLGAPFFRSNLVAFHYGNLTHPSVDPPRMGILSLVPSDADQRLRNAVQAAAANGGNFPNVLQSVPTGASLASASTTISPGPPASSTSTTSVSITEPVAISNNPTTVPSTNNGTSITLTTHTHLLSTLAFIFLQGFSLWSLCV